MQLEELSITPEDSFMIQITTSGDFHNIEKFLNVMKKKDYLKVLNEYGRIGVSALQNATPKRTGKTAQSWDYEIISNNGSDAIVWTNSNENKGVNIAVILQYGHGTRNGGYVVGIDYINPALKDVFNQLAEEVWREVTSA